jgi:hypothetical protein
VGVTGAAGAIFLILGGALPLAIVGLVALFYLASLVSAPLS